jgi:hypothetical protein
MLFGITLQSSIAQIKSPPFVITLSADKPAVTAGSDVYLSVRITNTSNHDVNCSAIPSEGIDLAYKYNIRRISGEPVAKIVSHFPRSFSVLPPCTLKPKEFDESKGGIIISRLYDMSSPGTYIIQVLRPIANSGNPKYGFVKSNELTITVLPAESKPSQ